MIHSPCHFSRLAQASYLMYVSVLSAFTNYTSIKLGKQAHDAKED